MQSHRNSLGVVAIGIVLGFGIAPVLAQGPIPTPIPHGPVSIELQPVATGLTSPDLMIPGPTGANDQFIVEQTGQVKLLHNGVMQSTPVLDISSRLNTIVNSPPTPNGLRAGYDERGLLGLAFDPNFNVPNTPGFHRIFTYNNELSNVSANFPLPPQTPIDSDAVVSSWKLDLSNPNQITTVPNSRTEILRLNHPQFNHDAGMLAFGPDGDLYISEGDGGGANDGGGQNPANAAGHNPITGNGQDTNTVLGKILRIDVGSNAAPANGRYSIPQTNPFANGQGGLPEIYAYGFRNPYRFSFDGNRLLVADVGQNNIEELDDVVNGGNYGWRLKEGTFLFNPTDGTVGANSPGSPAGLIDPILEYDHDEGIAIQGGFVYHGSAIPELQGKYVFGDFSKSFASPTGRLFYADLTTGQINELIIGANDRALGLFIKGLGIDQAGEIYVLGTTVLGPTGTTGVALKLTEVPEPSTAALLLGAVVLGGGVLGRGRRRNRLDEPACL